MAVLSSPLSSEIPIKETSSSHADVDSSEGRAERLTFERRTMRKIDLRLLPLLGMLYALALIDRTNLGVARIAGMERDLELSVGSRYSIVSALYFIPYIIFQLPSNLFLRQLGVRSWLTFCVVAWGVVQLAMGFVPNWGLLGFCRVLLGAFEAGFFPALVFIITTWYTRHEVQKRLAAFYVVSIFTGGFSAIFAYILSLLGGKQGIPGWAWIFIIEGAITILFGIIAWFFISDFPDQNTFLSEEQTAFVLDRVEHDRGDSIPDELTKKKLLEHLLDWNSWAFSLMYLCATMPAYAIGFFITIILRGMGWSVTNSLLLSAPPYVFATVSILFFAWISDKFRHRALFIAIQAIMTLVGLILTGFSSSAAWRYVGIFLSNAGSGGCIPGILAYSSNNITSHTKRAVSTAMIISFGGIGGIFATTVFRQKDFPRYLPGIYATIACQIILLLLLAITTIYFWKQNKRICAAAVPAREGQPGFIYTL